MFGPSRHLVGSADSATAAILAAGLAAAGSDEYVALAGLPGLMAAGFLTGVGIQVALRQIGGMLGLEGTGHGTIGKIIGDLDHIGETNVHALTIAVSVLGVIVGARKISPGIPGPPFAAVGATAASRAMDLRAHDAHVLGAIASGLPSTPEGRKENGPGGSRHPGRLSRARTRPMSASRQLRAAQRVIAACSRPLSRPASFAALVTWLRQLTNWHLFFAPGAYSRTKPWLVPAWRVGFRRNWPTRRAAPP